MDIGIFFARHHNANKFVLREVRLVLMKLNCESKNTMFCSELLVPNERPVFEAVIGVNALLNCARKWESIRKILSCLQHLPETVKAVNFRDQACNFP